MTVSHIGCIVFHFRHVVLNFTREEETKGEGQKQQLHSQLHSTKVCVP